MMVLARLPAWQRSKMQIQDPRSHGYGPDFDSGSANDINKYNQCIANQMQMARNQNRMELEYLRNEIVKLKEENFVLKQKLDQIKDALKNIFLNL